jgi:hypothetical protein
VPQLNTQSDAALISDRGNTKKVRDANNAEAADLEMAARDLWRIAYQIIAYAFDQNRIVRDQSVTARDKIKSAFRFSYTRVAQQQDADAIHPHQDTVDGYLRCEPLLQKTGNQTDSLRTDQVGLNKGMPFACANSRIDAGL